MVGRSVLLFLGTNLIAALVASDTVALDEALSSANPHSEVCTTEGCLVGIYKRGNVRPYKAFYGIPYAAPPLGPLRFKKPHPAPYYGRTWNSTYHRNECMQQHYLTKQVVGNEDCLYLNIYTPVKVGKSPLPVLVFIHGGAFKFGTSHQKIFGPDYLMDSAEIIVVTLQYRLGVFGFLSSGDEASKGNFGLEDQNMALRWLQANIKVFGGDPRAVTLMGDSGGGAAAHFHMMSPKSSGLFKKAIMIGGTALSFWALERNPQRQLREFASIAGIRDANNADTADIVEQLSQMSARDLQRYSGRMYSIHDVTPIFRPTIEGSWSSAFVSEDPLIVWKSGEYEQRAFLLVSSPNEQAISSDSYYDKKKRRRILNDFDNSLMEVGGLARNQLKPIKKYYFNNCPSVDNMYNFTVFRRDRWFYQPILNTGRDYIQYQNSERRPMDMLLFNFKSSYSLTQLFHPYSHPENGPSKLDFSLYLFTWRILGRDFRRGPAEEAAKDLMVKLVTQYVTRGLDHTRDYPVCTAKVMDRMGVCPYLYVERRGDEVYMGTSTEYDVGSFKVWDTIAV